MHKLNIKYNINALDMMIYYSFGLPVLMQEIGGGVFWFIEKNKYIDEEIVLKELK